MTHRVAKSGVMQKTKLAISVLAACFCVFMMLSVVVSPLSGQAGNGTGAGDPERGKQLFTQRCGGCHSLDLDKEGPRLHHVYGSKAGSGPTFKYSDALKSAHVTWDDTSLDKWLTNPDSLIPDNDMEFHVPKPDERADIIRFLRISSGK